MLIRRWQAPVVPDQTQMIKMFEMEGYEPFLETLEPEKDIRDHKHPFDEVRMVSSGELLMNVSGNQLLLRAGDRITIPSNTKHSKKVNSAQPCVCICAKKSF
jgi:quercetin dioxygenase-like cupin family protein